MNMKMIAGACLCAAAIVGCVSVEQTRLQLQSKDPEQVKKAEDHILWVAERETDVTGFIHYSTKDKLELVSLSSNPALLWKIAESSLPPQEVRLAAVERIDFSQHGAGMDAIKNHYRLLSYEICGEKGLEAVLTRIVSGMSEQELAELLADHDRDKHILRQIAEKRLCEIVSSTELMLKMFSHPIGDKGEIRKKILAIAKKSDDAEFIVKLLEERLNKVGPYLIDGEERKEMLGNLERAVDKMDEGKAVQFLLPILKGYNFWAEYYTIAAKKAKTAKDAKVAQDLSFWVLTGIANHYKYCIEQSSKSKSDWSFSDEKVEWSDWKNKDAMKLVSLLPSASNSFVAFLIKEYGVGMVPLMGVISPEVAYATVAEGKAETPALELELVKKLPREKMDLKVYNGVRSDEARKIIYVAMAPELQKQVREANEKVFAAIVEKAKSASKETFALDGFYLGMSWEDMKIVLAHHFPELEVTEKDDDGLELYVSNQKSAFCLATKEKKIYQFNFGKKMLKKWYKYDVQDYAQWVRAYGREHKVDMQYKMVEEEATVYEPMDPSRSYKVWFYQHSYQYKHNAKEYRLTYFGDEKDFTVHGGIGGALIKQLAAKKFRYTRGDPGSLRVYIDKD